jgi:hypothetical protein
VIARASGVLLAVSAVYGLGLSSCGPALSSPPVEASSLVVTVWIQGGIPVRGAVVVLDDIYGQRTDAYGTVEFRVDNATHHKVSVNVEGFVPWRGWMLSGRAHLITLYPYSRVNDDDGPV